MGIAEWGAGAVGAGAAVGGVRGSGLLLLFRQGGPLRGFTEARYELTSGVEGVPLAAVWRDDGVRGEGRSRGTC